MTRYPLTSAQAVALCNDFQYLTGKNFYLDNNAVQVSSVAVAPFDEVNKHIFVQQYKESEDPKEALQLYNGTYYDVIVIGKLISDKVQYVYKDLAIFMDENKIGFDITQYIQVQRSVY